MGLKSWCLYDKNGRKMKGSGKKLEGKNHYDSLAAGLQSLMNSEKEKHSCVWKVQKWPSEISHYRKMIGKTVGFGGLPLGSYSLWFWNVFFYKSSLSGSSKHVFSLTKHPWTTWITVHQTNAPKEWKPLSPMHQRLSRALPYKTNDFLLGFWHGSAVCECWHCTGCHSLQSPARARLRLCTHPFPQDALHGRLTSRRAPAGQDNTRPMQGQGLGSFKS